MDPTTPDAPLQWSDRLLLGFPAMDDEHREFVACVQALRTADEAGLLPHLDAFAAHAQRHFGSEDTWMTTTGFPARDCHIDEHAAVMKSVLEVRALVAADPRRHGHLVRSLAAELARWFPGHADYLDSALAAWLCKQRWNAKPLVLRRNIKDPAAS